LLALSFAGLLACNNETSTDAFVDQGSKEICDAVIACNCEYPNGAVYDHCIAQLTVNGDALVQTNRLEGLSFDGDCADEAVAAIKELGCGVNIADPDAKCTAECKLWYGPMGKGATCVNVEGFDNCKQGLRCGSEGVCIDPCAEPKLPKIGEVCGTLLGCVEGAFCDTASSINAVCQPLPAAGQPCTPQEERCLEGLICDTSDPDVRVCVVPPGVGAECILGQCATGLFCDNAAMPAVCAAPPTLGAACLGFCQAPYVCSADLVCIEPPPQVCGYYGGLPLEECADTEFTCGNGACIGNAQICDGMPQCADASDEDPGICGAPGCAPDEFTCADSTCISVDQTCDGIPDCLGGTDEAPFNADCP
jgi:hypothetical protein